MVLCEIACVNRSDLLWSVLEESHTALECSCRETAKVQNVQTQQNTMKASDTISYPISISSIQSVTVN